VTKAFRFATQSSTETRGGALDDRTLVDRFALQDVMATYAASVDERDLERHRACFADDVEVVGFARQTIRGIDAWMAFVTKALDGFLATQHLLGLQRAAVSGDTAHARTDVQAHHFMKEPVGSTFTLWATYETDFVRTAGGWRIKRHELVSRGSQRSAP
jgi:ketosteroid isomerase-like protein